MAAEFRETVFGPINGVCDVTCRSLWLGIVAGGEGSTPVNGAQAEIMRVCQAADSKSEICGYDGLKKTQYPRLGHPGRQVIL